MPYDPRWAMWLRACEMMEEADQLQREFFRLGDGRQERPNWSPPVDVLEMPDRIQIVAAIPGVGSEDVKVTFEGGSLYIRGRRSWPRALRRARIHRLELPHGRFERQVALPPGRYQLGEVKLIEGCLMVELRKAGAEASRGPGPRRLA